MEACQVNSLASEISPRAIIIKVIIHLYGLVGWLGWRDLT